MPIDSKELPERLAQADRTRLILRKATLELAALGREILKQRKQFETENDTNRSHGSDRGPRGNSSSS